MATMKIAVIGNCQARPLAELLHELVPDLQVLKVSVVHLLTDADADEHMPAYHEADLIVAQLVASTYPCSFVRTDQLKSEFSGKLIVWPNLYYAGYNPELRYLRGDGRRPVKGPLGDYHLQPIVDAWRAGDSADVAASRLLDVAYSQSRYHDVPDRSIVELRGREERCDVALSAWITERRWIEQLFFTFNHPTRRTLTEAARRLIGLAIGEAPPNAGIASDIRVEPLGQFRVPVNPWIRDVFKPTFAGSDSYVGVHLAWDGGAPRVTGKAEYQLPELVSEFYSAYEHQLQ